MNITKFNSQYCSGKIKRKKNFNRSLELKSHANYTQPNNFGLGTLLSGNIQSNNTNKEKWKDEFSLLNMKIPNKTRVNLQHRSKKENIDIGHGDLMLSTIKTKIKNFCIKGKNRISEITQTDSCQKFIHKYDTKYSLNSVSISVSPQNLVAINEVLVETKEQPRIKYNKRKYNRLFRSDGLNSNIIYIVNGSRYQMEALKANSSNSNIILKEITNSRESLIEEEICTNCKKRKAFCTCNAACEKCAILPCKCNVCAVCKSKPCFCKIACIPTGCIRCGYSPCTCSSLCSACRRRPCDCTSNCGPPCDTCGSLPCRCFKKRCIACHRNPCQCKSKICNPCVLCNKFPCFCKPSCKLCNDCCDNSCKCNNYCKSCSSVRANPCSATKASCKPCLNCQKNPCCCVKSCTTCFLGPCRCKYLAVYHHSLCKLCNFYPCRCDNSLEPNCSLCRAYPTDCGSQPTSQEMNLSCPLKATQPTQCDKCESNSCACRNTLRGTCCSSGPYKICCCKQRFSPCKLCRFNPCRCAPLPVCVFCKVCKNMPCECLRQMSDMDL